MRGSGFFRGDPSQIDFCARHSCLYRRRFFLCFFLYLVLYHVTVVNRFSLWSLNDVTWSLYCVDFSYGFASKLLPGAVYNLLAGAHASRASATYSRMRATCTAGSSFWPSLRGSPFCLNGSFCACRPNTGGRRCCCRCFACPARIPSPSIRGGSVCSIPGGC